jgi:iron(III) transport system substrate-binding protein
MRRFLACGVLLAASVLGVPLSSARNLVIYCSHDADACELAAQTFERETGIATAISRKPTGEFYAQIRAERDNPKADV